METGQEYIGDKSAHPVFAEILREKIRFGLIGQWKKTKWKQGNDV